MAAEGVPHGVDVHDERADRAGGRGRLLDNRLADLDAILAKGRANRSGRLFRQRILLFIAGRGNLGSSKNELFTEFKQVMPAQIMDELDNLVRLEALSLDVSGSKAFVKAAEAPGTTRYWATERGRRIAESPKGEELAIEEIV